MYQVANYLAALDQLFDEQAHLLREQTHRAEQAELAVRLQQVQAAQARQEPQPRSAVKQLHRRASDKPETGACKNGPGVEPQFRPSEKTMFYSGHP